MAEENDPQYTVGYGKPPKRTQFKPGQSGNPHGRPRKSTTFEDDVKAELRSTIVVTENGKPRKITKRRAIAKQRVHKAINGSIGSAKLLFNSMQQDPSDKQDHVAALVAEFRERNRQLANQSSGEDASMGMAHSTTPTRTEGEE